MWEPWINRLVWLMKWSLKILEKKKSLWLITSTKTVPYLHSAYIPRGKYAGQTFFLASLWGRIRNITSSHIPQSVSLPAITLADGDRVEHRRGRLASRVTEDQIRLVKIKFSLFNRISTSKGYFYFSKGLWLLVIFVSYREVKMLFGFGRWKETDFQWGSKSV